MPSPYPTTVPPASTREEPSLRDSPSGRHGGQTSSLQIRKISVGLCDAIFDKCVLGNSAFHRHFRDIQMMTWEENTDLLITFGEKVHVIRGDNADAVSLQLVPAG